MCEIHDPACVYMHFEGASSAPLLRQKSRCSDLGPASVFSDLLLTNILAAISKSSLTCEIDACVYLRFEGASSAPLVRALILLVFRSFRICCWSTRTWLPPPCHHRGPAGLSSLLGQHRSRTWNTDILSIATYIWRTIRLRLYIDFLFLIPPLLHSPTLQPQVLPRNEPDQSKTPNAAAMRPVCWTQQRTRRWGCFPIPSNVVRAITWLLTQLLSNHFPT